MKQILLTCLLLLSLGLSSCAKPVTTPPPVLETTNNSPSNLADSPEDQLLALLNGQQKEFPGLKGRLNVHHQVTKNSGTTSVSLENAMVYFTNSIPSIGAAASPYLKFSTSSPQQTYEFLEDRSFNTFCLKNIDNKLTTCDDFSSLPPSMLAKIFRGNIPLPKKLHRIPGYPQPNIEEVAQNGEKTFTLYDDSGRQLKLRLSKDNEILEASSLYAKKGTLLTGPWFRIWSIQFQRHEHTLSKIIVKKYWFPENSASNPELGTSTEFSFSQPIPTNNSFEIPSLVAQLYLEQWMAQQRFPFQQKIDASVQDQNIITEQSIQPIGVESSLQDITMQLALVPTPSVRASFDFFGTTKTLQIINDPNNSSQDLCQLVSENNTENRYNYTKMSAQELAYAGLGMVALPLGFKEATIQIDTNNKAQSIIKIIDNNYQILTVVLGPNFHVRRASRSYLDDSKNPWVIWEFNASYKEEFKKSQGPSVLTKVSVAGTLGVNTTDKTYKRRVLSITPHTDSNQK